jgi:transcriptional regulator with XRE-family HTH domain
MLTQMKLAEKIKQLRGQKGFSQDDLARQSGLSLRTIQRIEQHETIPRGYTLKQLAGALSVEVDTLILDEYKEGQGKANVFNLSALGFIAFPLLGLLLPLFIWILKKDRTGYEDQTARRVLNFQATWGILTFTMYVLTVFGKIFHLGGYFPYLLSCIALLYLVNLVFILVNLIRTAQSKTVFYQPAIPFFRT